MATLKLTSDTLAVTPAGGEIEYNGQFFGADSNNSRAQFQRLVLATAQNSTSGTSIDFTGIPSWVKRITVMFQGVSTNSTSLVQIQLGNGSVVTTGYVCNGWTANITNNTSTTGLLIGGGAGNTYEKSGIATLALMGSNLWAFSYSGGAGTAGGGEVSGGYKTLSGTLDRIRITTVNGTDTFDAGSINILYEG